MTQCNEFKRLGPTGDYSYLGLKVTDGNNLIAEYGVSGRVKELPDPSGMFLNAREVFAISQSEGCVLFNLWADGCPSVGLAMESGVKVSAEAVLRVLREATALRGETPIDLFKRVGLPADPLPLCKRPRSASVPVALAAYMSTAELLQLMERAMSGEDLPADEIIAVEATAVPVGEATSLPRVEIAPSSQPDFEVVQPAEPVADRKPTLQEIEDEIDNVEPVAPYRPEKHRRSNAIVFGLLAIVALALGWAAVKYLPQLVPDTTPYDGMESQNVSELVFDTDPYAQPADTTVMALQTDSVPTDTVLAEEPELHVAEAVTPVEEPQEAAVSASEQADIDYLNSTNRWQRSRLKSQKYIDFFDSFATGDIELIVSSDYFAKSGEATNRTAIRLADMMWQAHRSPTEQSNRRQLRQLKGKQEIDIAKLYDTLSRYRDANPNKSPRPKR